MICDLSFKCDYSKELFKSNSNGYKARMKMMENLDIIKKHRSMLLFKSTQPNQPRGGT